jgi:hypothetical protein
VRPLGVALAACVLFATPAPLLAQQPAALPIGAQPPVVQPLPPARPHPPRPAPTRPNNRHRPTTPYPVIIDSSVVNRFLGPPAYYAPAPVHKATPRPKVAPNGQDVFETHSTEDNAK